MRKTLLSALVVALLLGGHHLCPAQVTPGAGLKPLVTVSFAGYDELRADIEYVGKLSNSPQLAQGLEGMLKMMTGGQGLAGLDTKKPWGAVVQTDGQQSFPIYGFVPVTDLKQLMGAIGRLLPGGPPAENGGVYEIATEGPTLLVQQKGNWAFIATNPQDLASAPADPQKVLGTLSQKYDLAVRASIQNVPVMFREMVIQQMKAGAEIGMVRLPDESDEDFALRQGVSRRMIEQLTTMINDLDEVLIGWAIDRQAGSSYLDLQVTAVAGSKTAAQFAQQQATAKTNFAGFDLPGAALTGNWAGTLSDSDVTQAKDSIASIRVAALSELKNQGLSADELTLATQLLNDLIDVLEKTIEGKKADGGLALVLKPGALTLVAGGAIAEGDKLEATLKRLVAEVQKEEPDVAQLLKLDAGTHQGVRLHTLSIPTAEMDDEMATKLFGPTLDVVLGINNTSVYVSVGRDAQSTLKQVIDQSKVQANKEIPPGRITLAATPIAKFVADVADDEMAQQMAAMIGAMLEQTSGKDHVILTSKPIPNGTTVRLEVEEGLLKVLGSMWQMMGGGPPAAAVAPADGSF